VTTPGPSPKSGPSSKSGPSPKRVPLIGLIGPIGSGKSTVAGWLAERGAVIIDADELTRELMAPGTPLADSIIGHFGARYRRADGSLDRDALGRLVFSDPTRLAELEALVHPVVGDRLPQVVSETRAAGPRAVVLEAIKLVEAGHASLCDEVWLVICKPATQLDRLVARGMSEADARQRIAAQAGSLMLWCAAAARVIDTEGSPVAAERAVDAALEEVAPAGAAGSGAIGGS
jgi:dephospho-CoA kinase